MSDPARRLDAPDRPPLALHDKAMDDLRFIRETMERSGSFTHVSGLGWMIIGSIALVASILATGAADPTLWLLTWLGAATLALPASLMMMNRKSRAEGASLLAGPGRKFAWNVTPPLVAGAILTGALVQAGALSLLPGTWLLMYGTSVVTGGSYSVRSIPAMGLAFMVAGVAALVSPEAWGDVYMAIGFGGLHLVFGLLIWRKHGG